MKEIVFDYLSDLGEAIIFGIQIIAEFAISIQANLANSIIRIIANSFKSLLWLVDRGRVDHAEQVIDQMSLNNELTILMSVTKIKEDALEHRSWTNKHSIALNELSSKLYNECDWDKSKIHDYMRAIVESIPGLSYVAGDDEDDDDPIDLDD